MAQQHPDNMCEYNTKRVELFFLYIFKGNRYLYGLLCHVIAIQDLTVMHIEIGHGYWKSPKIK